jgi:hypothetical protein
VTLGFELMHVHDSKLLAPLTPELSVNRLHRRFTALRIMRFELSRRAESSRRRDDRLFTSHLVDLITAIVMSPVSDETSGLLRERSQKNWPWLLEGLGTQCSPSSPISWKRSYPRNGRSDRLGVATCTPGQERPGWISAKIGLWQSWLG